MRTKKSDKNEGNPFTLMFGKEPLQRISRASQMETILNDYRSEFSSSQICMITGIRGSGKTVFMTELARELKTDKDWVVSRAEDRVKAIEYRHDCRKLSESVLTQRG